MQQRPKKLLDQVREVIQLRHYSYRTEETYVQWIRRYILFHNKRHPIEMGRLRSKPSSRIWPCKGQLPPRRKTSTQRIAVLYREVLR
jgi:hypothetical protein